MTELLSGVDAPSDAELISRVRGGDIAAYGDLFARHVEAARRLGRQLVRGPDVDDLVSDAFAKVLLVLQGGGGPDVAFRAYLLTSVRRLHVDRVRAAARVQPSDDMTKYDPGIPFQDTAVAGFESGAAAKAFASLPERWQLVLWHLEVEGQKPADIAPLLGMSANSVSALAYRAREGLRQAFLTMHLADSPTDQCRWVNEHLGAYVRKGLSKRDTGKVQQHLDECRRCTAMYLELTEVNSNLSGIIAPLLLGAAAAGYLSSTSGAAGATGLFALFGRARDVVAANAGAATAGAVAAGVAAVATTAFVFGGAGDREVVVGADEEITMTTPVERAPADADKMPRVEARTAADDDPPAGTPTELESSPAGGVPAVVVPTESPTSSPTPSPTSSPTESPIESASAEATVEASPTDGPASGPDPTETPAESPGVSPTESIAPSPTVTDSTTPSSSETPSQTVTAGPTETTPPDTAAPSPTPTETASPGQTPTETATPSPTPTETATPSLSVEATVDGDPGSGYFVSLTVTGSTELPDRVEVTVQSSPPGVTFGGGGTTCALTPGKVPDCPSETQIVTQMAEMVFGTTFGETVVLTAPTTLQARIPLSDLQEQPEGAITFTVSAPGYAVSVDDSYRYVPPPVDLVSAGFTSYEGGRHVNDRGTATMNVVVRYARPGALTFKLPPGGGVSFETGLAPCTVSDGTGTCRVDDFGTFRGTFAVSLPFGQLSKTELTLLEAEPDDTEPIANLTGIANAGNGGNSGNSGNGGDSGNGGAANGGNSGNSGNSGAADAGNGNGSRSAGKGGNHGASSTKHGGGGAAR